MRIEGGLLLVSIVGRENSTKSESMLPNNGDQLASYANAENSATFSLKNDSEKKEILQPSSGCKNLCGGERWKWKSE